MASPYRYPTVRHSRTITPPVFANYRLYKPYLRQEFRGQCVFCRSLDAAKGEESFGADHYRPKSRFPHLANEYRNLFYACNRCNSYKGNYWPSPGEKKRGAFVPNPCDDILSDHLRYTSGRVVAKSVTGRWVIEHLDLNDTEAVLFRTGFIASIQRLDAAIQSSKKSVSALEKELKKATKQDDKDEVDAYLKRASRLYDSLMEERSGLLGLAA